MRLITLILGLARLAYSIPVNVEQNALSSQRYIVMFGENGVIEVVDTEAPLPPIEPRVSASDITFLLYTRRNPTTAEVLPLDVPSLSRSTFFDRNKLNYFIIHGWNNKGGSRVNIINRDALLARLDVNVFVVDWSGPASGLYSTSVLRVPRVGALLGRFLSEMQRTFNLDASRFILLGYSLGAHVAGCAGAEANSNIGVIVGLDSAGPLFSMRNTANRLDPTDARFVQAIHTNDALLGFSGDHGHADIRPNGGGRQAGCGLDPFGICSHPKAYLFFAESVLTGGFTSWFCNNHNSFTSGNCWNNGQTRLGGVEIDTSARGNHFLTTNPRSPFSQG